MNRRGQILVFFIILIPILVALAAFTIDLGSSYYQSNKLHNINKMAIRYGLKHITDVDVRAKIINLIYKNDSHIDSYDLKISNGTIILVLNKTTTSVFGKALNVDFYYISSKYKGYIKNNKIIIEKG